MDRQSVSINVHHPRVSNIRRFPQHDNVLTIDLSNGTMNGEVTLFLSDAEWWAIVRAVAEFHTDEALAAVGK